jgi:cathepsin A (carboxypeptidase C)
MAISTNDHPAAVDQDTYQGMVDSIPACIKMIQACNNNGSISTCNAAQSWCDIKELNPYYNTGLNPYDMRIPCVVPGLCYNFTDIDNYLNLQSVQQYLGVNLEWESCSTPVNQAFAGDWMKDYAGTIPYLLNDGIRVLIYAGDQDFVCNWLGNEAWTSALEWPGQTVFNSTDLSDWTAQGQSSANGQIRQYKGLSFLRVYDAGHMVPYDQPEVALQMTNAFINNKL